MIFLEILSWCLFAYLAYYLFYKFIIVMCSSSGHIKDIKTRDYEPKYSQNLSVIIYSHNNASGIIELIEAFKKQNYEKDKISINVILDNCTDNSSKLLEILGGCRIWRIKTDVGAIGKFKSYAWLMERIVATETSNAYVFLSSDCLVKPDFLSNINSAIIDKPVVIGDTVPLNSDHDLITQLVCFKNKLRNRVNVHGRFYAGLFNVIDSDVFAIQQNIAENYIYNITDDGFEEYEYSFKLAKNNIKVAFCQDIQVLKKYSESIATAKFDEYIRRYKKFITFKNYVNIIFNNNYCLKSKELLFNLLFPPGMVFLALISLLWFISSHYSSLTFSHIVNNRLFLFSILTCCLLTLVELIVARSGFRDYKNAFILLIFNPIILILSTLQGFSFNFTFKNIFKKKPQQEKVVDEFEKVDAILTDGRKSLKCKLELVKNENENQIIFHFRGKKLPSAAHPRIDRALEEIANKLNDKGFNLKVCLNCGYCRFNDAIAANTNGEHGYCLYENVNNESNAKNLTYIWANCSRIIPSQSKKLVEDQLKNR